MNMNFYKMIIIVLLLSITLVSCKSLSSNLNIVEGSFVNDSDYPTMILLRDYDYVPRCAGVIVSENVVITSAHCLLDLKDDESSDSFSYKLVHMGALIDNEVLIGSRALVVLPEFEKKFVQNHSTEELKTKIENDYVLNKSISRSSYEQKILALKKYFSSSSYDLGALIFEDRTNHDDPPFRPMIEEAKAKGKFFTLSRKSFSDESVIGSDKKSVFFLGYGLSNTYKNLNDLEEGDKGVGTLQIGYNAVKYSKNKSEWVTPKPTDHKITRGLYNRSNTISGDDGGPLIYKNQIIGIASFGAMYDYEGNDIYTEPLSDRYLGVDLNGNSLTTDQCVEDPYCAKVFYASSYFSSLTLGSNLKVVESFFSLIDQKLKELNLYENGKNSIFSDLLEKR